MDRLAGPLIAIAFIALVGVGVYAYVLRGQLAEARASAQAAYQSLSVAQRQADEAGAKVAAGDAALQQCNGLLQEANARAEAAEADAANAKPQRRR